MPFERATKEQHRLRVAIDGPSGSGKTVTSLILAHVFAGGDTFAVVDTERGAASLYADLEIDGVKLVFDRLELDEYSPSAYIKAMKDAAKAGYKACVLDSITHEWNGNGGILQIVDDEQTRRKQSSSYQAWSVGKAEHRKFVDAMLGTPYHLVVTMRSKMEHVLQDSNGKKEVKKVGMAPVQSDGMEYEFDIVADMDLEHNLIVSKTRYFDIADMVAKKPGVEFANRIYNWAMSGAAPTVKPVQLPQVVKDRWFELQAMAVVRGMSMPEISPEWMLEEVAEQGRAWDAKIKAHDDGGTPC